LSPFVTRRQIFILLLPLSRNGIIPNVLADLVVDQRDGHHAHLFHEVVVDAVSAFTIVWQCSYLTHGSASCRHDPELCDVVRATEITAASSPFASAQPAVTLPVAAVPAKHAPVAPTKPTPAASNRVEMNETKNIETKSENFDTDLPGSIQPIHHTPIEKL
jgi:hypothetical protein